MSIEQDIAAVERLLERWRQLELDVHAYVATPARGKAAPGSVIATVAGRLVIAGGDHLSVRGTGAVIHLPSLRNAMWAETSNSPRGTRVEIGLEDSVYNLFEYFVYDVPEQARFATDLTVAGFHVQHYHGEQMFYGPCIEVGSEQDLSAAISSTSVKLQSERTAAGYLVYPVANDDGHFDGAVIIYGEQNETGILRPLTGRRLS